MKTVSIEVSDEVADGLVKMDRQKRNLLLKFVTDMEKDLDWRNVFAKTAEQAKKQGLTDDKLEKLLKK